MATWRKIPQTHFTRDVKDPSAWLDGIAAELLTFQATHEGALAGALIEDARKLLIDASRQNRFEAQQLAEDDQDPSIGQGALIHAQQEASRHSRRARTLYQGYGVLADKHRPTHFVLVDAQKKAATSSASVRALLGIADEAPVPLPLVGQIYDRGYCDEMGQSRGAN